MDQSGIRIVLLQVGKSPEHTQEEEGNGITEVVDLVIGVPQELRLLTRQHTIPVTDLPDVPIHGQQGSPAALQHRRDHRIRPLHVVVQPLEIGILSPFSCFQERDQLRHRQPTERVVRISPSVILCVVYREHLSPFTKRGEINRIGQSGRQLAGIARNIDGFG